MKVLAVTVLSATVLVTSCAGPKPAQSPAAETHLTSGNEYPPSAYAATSTLSPPVAARPPETDDRTALEAPAPRTIDDTRAIEITAGIRKALMADSALSFDARNIDIVTNGGVVTLRGHVASEREKQAIERYARRQDGVTSIDDQLEVR